MLCLLRFVLVTHTGNTLYCVGTSFEHREEWMLHVRAQLEANFANKELAAYRVHKVVAARQLPRHDGRCAATRQSLSLHAAHFCPSCGRGFVSAEYIEPAIPLLHIGREQATRVCRHCHEMQLTLLWVKAANYAHVEHLHHHSEATRANLSLFKASFRQQRSSAASIDMAGRLFDQGDISAEELAELRAVEYAAEMDQVFKNCGELFEALEAVGSDMQTVLGLLTSSTLIRSGDRHSYKTILFKLIQLAGELAS